MEKYIFGGRDSGKTRRLLEIAKQRQAAVICKNPYAMQNKAMRYGIVGLTFYSYDQIKNALSYDMKIRNNEIVIDEASDFLSYLLEASVGGYTQTEE